MIMSTLPAKKLPVQFTSLQAWDSWIETDERLRVQHITDVSVDELSAFYQAVLLRAAEIYDYLDDVKLDQDISSEDMALLLLAVAAVEISDGAEFYAPDRTSAVAMPRLVPMHESVLGWKH